ncbi:MAG: hypothetical protein ACAI38_05065 [Myxococcota bacterium]|nr:hypothetical protein [Myxococcota bacterium]
MTATVTAAESRGADTASAWFGAALTATHLLTVYFWREMLPRIAKRDGAICWPQLPDCEAYRPLLRAFADTGLAIYAMCAALVVALFLTRRFRRVALGGLALLTVVKLGVIAQDFRFMGNFHDMPLMATIAYLMAPRRLDVAQTALVAFYVGAGVLKINVEWLSGAAMIRPSVLAGTLLERFALAYVVVLELVLVFGLLSRHRWVRWATLAQLAMFHAFSWHIVGYFYPLVMACLLSVFPLAWRAGASLDFGDFFSGRATRRAYAFAAVFAFCQLTPAFYPGDSALTGEGRFLSLDMFDAFSRCEHIAFVTAPERGIIVEEALPTSGSVRVHCDPIMFWNHMRRACDGLVADARLDAALFSRRTTAPEMLSIFELSDVCKSVPVLDAVRPSPWIEPRPMR